MHAHEAELFCQRVDYIRYLYQNKNKHPVVYEGYPFPIAVYDRSGIIVSANKLFRELAGIHPDSIQNGAANVFRCLNEENAGLMEAAQDVFNNQANACQAAFCPLRTKTKSAAYQSARLPKAVFLPMTSTGDVVQYGAVYFIAIESDDDEMLD